MRSSFEVIAKVTEPFYLEADKPLKSYFKITAEPGFFTDAPIDNTLKGHFKSVVERWPEVMQEVRPPQW